MAGTGPHRFAAAAAVSALTVALPAGAQPGPSSGRAAPTVRLEIHSEIWLGSTPLPLEARLRTSLTKAGILISDAKNPSVDALVSVLYAEDKDLKYAPDLYGTRIQFGALVHPSTTGGGVFVVGGMESPPPDEFASEPPTSEAVRRLALEQLAGHDAFSRFGDVIGALLGVESSVRVLLSDAASPWAHRFGATLVLSGNEWTLLEENDLFVRAARVLQDAGVGVTSVHLESFLTERMEARVLGRTRQSTAAALEAVGALGGESAIVVLERLAGSLEARSDAELAAAIRAATNRITLRLAPK